MSANSDDKKLQVYVSPELEYVYRDVFNVFVGIGDVLIEFGNRHKSIPNSIVVSNRIVMTVANAHKLVQMLTSALKEAEQNLQLLLKNSTGND